MASRLKEWEDSFGISGQVKYLGSVKGAERLKVLSEATVFVLPSYSENFGLAVLEAIAAGCRSSFLTGSNIHQEISDAKLGWVTKMRCWRDCHRVVSGHHEQND